MAADEVLYDKDADLSVLEGKTVAILGYGSQGHAHALNLKDSGIDVVVGLRPDSSSRADAEAEGLEVLDVADAASRGDIVMILLPDEKQAEVWDAVRSGTTAKAAPAAPAPRMSMQDIQGAIDALTRQGLPLLRTTHTDENLSAKGAYVLIEPEGRRDVTLIGTGSEVSLAVTAAYRRRLPSHGGIALAIRGFHAARQDGRPHLRSCRRMGR